MCVGILRTTVSFGDIIVALDALDSKDLILPMFVRHLISLDYSSLQGSSS